MPIIKKTTINNTIFKELNDKYPPVSAENGVTYKQKLEYLTFETDFMTDTNLRKLRKKYGNDILAVIFYLRTKMCDDGWKVRADGDDYNYLIGDCAYNCGIDDDAVNAMIQDLIQSQIFFSVQDESFEEGIWLTCPQQVYNYEMACNNRQLSRARNAKKRARQAEQHNQFTGSPPSNFDSYGNTSSEASEDTDDPFELFSNS